MTERTPKKTDQMSEAERARVFPKGGTRFSDKNTRNKMRRARNTRGGEV